MNNDDSSINFIRCVEKPECTQIPLDFHIDLWQDGPLNRWAFQHVSDFLPTHEICAKETHSCTNSNTDFSAMTVNLLENLDINVDGNIFKFTKILEETCTDSIVVLCKGNLVYERYFNEMKTDS